MLYILLGLVIVGLKKNNFVKKIAFFASGSGTNIENIHHYFKENKGLCIDSIWTNNKDAGVIQRMAAYGYHVNVFESSAMRSGSLLNLLQSRGIDGIVLAGFLLLIPQPFIEAYPQKIINIHPALLPKYGGKGMYGQHVHKAVWENRESETGITIHYVNEVYDAGNIIFQSRVKLNERDTPESIAKKVHQLEYAHFPKIIASIFDTDG